MEETVKQMFEGGITPELLVSLGIVIITIMSALWIRSWIQRQLAYLKFKGSMDISKDVVVREGTSTGYIDFRLISVDKVNILLISIDQTLKKIIPTISANDREWIIVRREAANENIPTEDE